MSIDIRIRYAIVPVRALEPIAVCADPSCGGRPGPTLPVGWSLAGVADFNRNGKTDYALFKPSTCQSAIYYLSGPAYVSSAYGPTIPTGYELMGTADFNADNKPD